MTTTNSFARKIAVITGLLLGAFAISALADWAPPLSGPPACTSGNPGCDSPLNAGGLWQYKTGPVTIGSNAPVTPPAPQPALTVVGKTVLANVGITGTAILGGGSPANGKVLTSTDSSGTTAWGNAVDMIRCNATVTSSVAGWNGAQWTTAQCTNKTTGAAMIPVSGCIGSLSQSTAQPANVGGKNVANAISFFAVSPGDASGSGTVYPNGGWSVYTITAGSSASPPWIFVSALYVCPN